MASPAWLEKPTRSSKTGFETNVHESKRHRGRRIDGRRVCRGIGTNTVSGLTRPATRSNSGTSLQRAEWQRHAGRVVLFPQVSGTPAAIAVDNSTIPSDPSRGDLYVMDAGHNVIDKFSSTGAYLSQITGPFEVGRRGLALTANGEMRVAVQLARTGRGSGPGPDRGDRLFDNSTVNSLIKRQEGDTRKRTSK